MSEFTSCNDCQNRMTTVCNYCKHNKLNSHFCPKPKKKIIDLSVCIDSGIDMEFGATDIKHIGTLLKIEETRYFSKNIIAGWYTECRVRQDHWHSWQGGKCPLPEGLEVALIYRNRGVGEHKPVYLELDWSHDNRLYDIIAFKVISVADGYKYEWQD